MCFLSESESERGREGEREGESKKKREERERGREGEGEGGGRAPRLEQEQGSFLLRRIGGPVSHLVGHTVVCVKEDQPVKNRLDVGNGRPAGRCELLK